MDSRPAFSCEFVGASRHCSHSPKELFHPTYQRTNRTHRTKIIRCFPHCCPRHLPRSYCGAPIRLRVKAESSSDIDGVAMADLQVFARFRPVHTTAMTIGTRIEASTITSHLQSEQTTTAEWIISRAVHAPCTTQDTWLIELNPSGRWYYAWDSGATKVRRQTRHILEVVVVLPCDGGESFQIVATVCSPSFTFVSFRRSADNEIMDADPAVLHQQLRLKLQNQELETKSSSEDDQSPLSKAHQYPVARQTPLRPQVDVGAFLTWTIGFVDGLSASQLPQAIILHGKVPDVEQNSSPRRVATINDLVTGIDAVETAIRLVWRLRTSQRVALVTAQYSSWAVDALLDRDALRLAFSQWMQVIRQHIETILNDYKWTIEELFRTLAAMNVWRGDPMSSVHRHGYDWRSFVANVRQQRVFQHQLGRMSHPTVFHHEWSCGLGDVEISLDDDGVAQQNRRYEPLHQLSAGCVSFFWMQLSRLRMDTSQLQSANQLRVVSTLHSHVLTQPVVFLLDDQNRRFDIFPHGESTMGGCLPGGYSTGDYRGFVCPHSGRVHLTTFVWPTSSSTTTSAYRWHWTMEITESSTMRLSVRVDLGSITVSNDCDPLETLPHHAKLALVHSWKSYMHAVLPYTRTG